MFSSLVAKLRRTYSSVSPSLRLPKHDRASTAMAERIRRDVDSGLASHQVLGTPTLFIDGIVHRGGYDPRALLAALAP